MGKISDAVDRFLIFRSHTNFQRMVKNCLFRWDLERPNLKWPKEKRLKKFGPKKRLFSIWPNIQIAESAQMAESRASGPPPARARFSPLALDSANFTV
jgi:hypothetical protein